MEISVQEAQDQLEDLLEHVAKGEEVIIVENGEPAAMLVAYDPKKSAVSLGNE